MKFCPSWFLDLLNDVNNVKVLHDINQSFFRKIKNIKSALDIFILGLAARSNFKTIFIS